MSENRNRYEITSDDYDGCNGGKIIIEKDGDELDSNFTLTIHNKTYECDIELTRRQAEEIGRLLIGSMDFDGTLKYPGMTCNYHTSLDKGLVVDENYLLAAKIQSKRGQ